MALGDPAPTEAFAVVDSMKAWTVVRAVSRHAARVAEHEAPVSFDLGDDQELRRLSAGHADAVVTWRPGTGWETALPSSDPRHTLIDLYLPICAATAGRPITVGHLGQSLDGFIATHTGDSQFVTGEENIRHLHRMRALSDAVVVGAGTVAADNPRLTTRQVPGPNPIRVVIDPMRRLGDDYRVFHDGAAPTLYACAKSLVSAGDRRMGVAELVGIDDGPGGLDLGDLIRKLRARGCARVFVEGGGVTVSAFFEAKLLDRLHVAVAPFFIGAGRPAIRFAAPDQLRDCARPRHRVFRMGTDVLFDCELTPHAGGHGAAAPNLPSVTRMI